MLQSNHTPPIPSPARLGIISSPSSNPNIPKPPLSSSSTPNPHHQQQQLQQPPFSPSPSSSTLQQQQSITSTTALLPPLARAQSLLLQMSSLASNLFHSSPNRSLWSSSYRGSIPSFLPSNSQQSQSQSHLFPHSTKEILSLFHSLQTLLFDSITSLQEILDLQDSTNSLSRQISALDSSLLSFARTIRSSHLALDRLLEDYSHYRSRDLNCPNLDLNELLSYAHRISYTTFAPPDHAAGLAPLRGALPPAPQDNEMRASQLYHFVDLDVGVPKVAAAAGAAPAAAEMLMEATPPREEAPPVPMLPIAVPPGWRKGMPVELPVELPPVPAGWKPGDPVALPPVPAGWKPGDPVPLPLLDAGVGRVEEVGRVPAAAQKAPEAIQVKYVSLDINQDEDEYSSDYSTELGSSDEEDDD